MGEGAFIERGLKNLMKYKKFSEVDSFFVICKVKRNTYNLGFFINIIIVINYEV